MDQANVPTNVTSLISTFAESTSAVTDSMDTNPNNEFKIPINTYIGMMDQQQVQEQLGQFERKMEAERTAMTNEFNLKLDEKLAALIVALTGSERAPAAAARHKFN